MKLSLISLSLLALVGCEHTKKDTAKDNVRGSAGGTTNSEAGGNGAPKTAPKMPSVPSDAVRPPTKEDLATYLAKVPGSGSKLMATIATTMGDFHCELFPDQAPITVANFVGLATGEKAWQNPKTGNTEQGVPFFEGIIFHRVIPEFMVQVGDPLGRGTGGPGYQFQDEFSPQLRMKPGTLAMANSGPATNGSQFFITEVETKHLNDKHTIFGQCAEVELVQKISGVEKLPGDRPKEPISITKVTFEKK